MSDLPLYRDPAAKPAERVDDLLARMTPAEKGQQLQMLDRSWGDGESFLRDGRFDPATAAANLGPDGHGSLSQRQDDASPHAYAESSNAVQRYLAEHTRLGIPALFIGETLHGLVGPAGTTVFPQAIGLAASWNPELLEQVGLATAREARAVGTHVGLSPVLDVCRDPRWGRLEETYGEDPFLVSRLGVAMVRGLQGGDGAGPGLVATVKHFAGHGAPQGGRDSAPSGHGREFLREFALPPFEAAVREAGAGGVMAAYSDWCYVPCNASHELLTEILRDEWGFGGFVIEDMGAIGFLHTAHAVAADTADAAVQALRAGVDQSFASALGPPVVDAVRAGVLDEEVLDRAVRRVLRTKVELGLFEDPYVDATTADAVCDSPEHRALAREAARQSVVLLQNDGTLPLRADLGTIAVIGPNAGVAETGDYSGRNPDLVTPLAGIGARAGTGTAVLYTEGCPVVDQPPDDAGIAAAARIAARADVAVVVVGGSAATSGEIRDAGELDLTGRQDELIRAVHATGTPVVLVHIGGRPNTMEWAFDHVAAAVAAWNPGEEGGSALADVLFGDVAPSGKLPVQWPAATAQLPSTYDYMHTGRDERGRYVNTPVAPRFPFGHGLSYTTFEYGEVGVEVGQDVTVTVEVTNTGDRDGVEVAQLYLRDLVASLKRPMRQLKAFRRVTLRAGEARRVVFTLSRDDLAFWNAAGERVVEPGEFAVMVGGDSTTTNEARFDLP
ncbi:glycoside hydrolase family 3 N-terminal domain-containing protein [Jiangella asiatica]|uniref:Exo-alpha-(1->6)-L-arabinopyranosidase n=1 Tax=Jiangella asiatica TaxID=2530372 RepID=A0A4R5DDH3_9ACTN|nr:glycoside hydrolase family 3 N-terminal domain-containing protein [Jiangella asiatica]TDE09891.1 beta-glucosidase [Jiangella asiatica]